MERLSVTALCEDFEDGKISNAGKIPLKHLHRIREVVSEPQRTSETSALDSVRH
jgi:hypothetical protein